MEQMIVDTGPSWYDIAQWVWLLFGGIALFFAKRYIQATDEKWKNVFARLSELERNKTDETQIFKEVGRNEGAISQMHKRQDKMFEDIAMLKARAGM